MCVCVCVCVCDVYRILLWCVWMPEEQVVYVFSLGCMCICVYVLGGDVSEACVFAELAKGRVV